MSIFKYLDNYGRYSFNEKAFNEVDNVIFSTLIYVDFSKILFNKKLTIKEVADSFFKQNDKKAQKSNILAVREAIKLLKNVKDTKRFKDIEMSNYQYIGTDSSQFSAVTYRISNKLYYVAYEGTDQLISGWKEDCEMAYKFPVSAQVYAIKYLNKYFTFNFDKLIVGGHSKGGNLALVASMYCNFIVKRKIVSIYSNDGQGLRKEQIESKKYRSITDKYNHIIPQYSVVGLLLRHDNNYKVIHSSVPGLLAHCTSYWKVEDNHFKIDKLTKFSKVLDNGITKWLDKYSDNERKLFVDSIFLIFEENNISSLLQLKKKIKLIYQVIKSSKDINPIVKEMLKDLKNILISTNKEFSWL